MDCTIIRREAGSAVHLLGRVRSDVSAHIHYCLTIARSGQSGAATLAEIGDVDVRANTPTDFGHTQLSLRADTALDAHLVVTWGEGSMECDLGPASNAPRAKHSPRAKNKRRHRPSD